MARSVSASPWTTASPRLTQSCTPAWLSSMPRASTSLVPARKASSAPSSQPTSSTRVCASTRSAIRRRSWRSPSLPAMREARSAQAVLGRGAFEEAGQHPVELRLVEQEGVVVAIGLDLAERDVGRHRVQRAHQIAALGGRKQPVGAERDHAKAGARAAKRLGEHAALRSRQVEIVHRARDVEIGVGIEAVDETDALMAQVALDLEVGVEAIGQARAI